MATIYNILLRLDGYVYDLIAYIYEIFEYLAKVSLFQEETYIGIVNRIYVVLGLIMLFVLAYTLLKAVIDPDTFAKGEQSFPKLIQNVIVSLIIIVILPQVFSVAYNIQNSILNFDTIPRIVMGSDFNSTLNPSNPGERPGKRMAFYAFTAFFHESEEWCKSKDSSFSLGDASIGQSSCASQIKDNGSLAFRGKNSLSDVTRLVQSGESFTRFNQFGEAVRDGEIEYMFIISTLAGIFVAYVLLNFCFDMGIRVIKLMFFEIIAPIPVVCRILPGGKMKDVFPDWVKKTVSTFVDVFIRIAIMYMGVFLITQVIGNFEKGNLLQGNLSGIQFLLVKAFLIMGVVAFIKSAPKLISDMFHLDTGSMSLGIMNKLSQGGGLLAAGAIGAGAGMLARNAVNAGKNIRSAEGWRNKLGAGIRGLGSIAAGTVSGAARGGWAGRNAKSIADVRKATSGAINAATDARDNRVKYRASHGGTFGAVVGHHVLDAAQIAGEYLGINDVSSFVDDNKVIDDIAGKKKAVSTAIESLVDKEAAKGHSDFGFVYKGRTFSATRLRKINLALQDAAANGYAMVEEYDDATGLVKRDANGDVITRKMTAAEVQQLKDDYRYDMTQAGQNIALSDSLFELTKDPNHTSPFGDVSVKFVEARAAGVELKETLSKNLHKTYVKEAGFTTDNVRGDLDVITKGTPLKDIGDILDRQKAENNAEIARRQREKAERDNK